MSIRFNQSSPSQQYPLVDYPIALVSCSMSVICIYIYIYIYTLIPIAIGNENPPSSPRDSPADPLILFLCRLRWYVYYNIYTRYAGSPKSVFHCRLLPDPSVVHTGRSGWFVAKRNVTSTRVMLFRRDRAPNIECYIVSTSARDRHRSRAMKRRDAHAEEARNRGEEKERKTEMTRQRTGDKEEYEEEEEEEDEEEEELRGYARAHICIYDTYVYTRARREKAALAGEAVHTRREERLLKSSVRESARRTIPPRTPNRLLEVT